MKINLEAWEPSSLKPTLGGTPHAKMYQWLIPVPKTITPPFT
jgi:hypothetical protein